MTTRLILFATLFIVACNPGYNETEETPEKPQPITVEKVTEENTPIPISTSGILGAKTSLIRSFKIGGIIDRILVDEGQQIKKGQLLASLDQVEIRAQVKQAQLAADKARRDLQRAENLYRDSVITLEQLQDLRTVKEASDAALRIARFNETHAAIVAEEDGSIQKRFAEAGELVQPGTPVFQVAYTHKGAFIMRIGVSDRDVVRLQLQDSAIIYFDAHPGVQFPARISEIAELADPGSFTFEVELTLLPSDLILKNGFIGKVTMFPGRQDPYYRIPMNALVQGDEDSAEIYVVHPSSSEVSRKHVTPQFIGDGYFTVSAQNFGDPQWVVVRGAPYIEQNRPVEITQIN
jgi:RND family efflux transporter MFP subunit